MITDVAKKALIVAAHPDDEVLGCGGTIAKLVDNKAEVFALFLGEGVSARFPLNQYDSSEFKEQSEVRLNGAKEALSTLGIKDYRFGDRYCCQFDQSPLLGITKDIEAAIREFKPDTVLTHNPVEVNIDHKITYTAVENACRPQVDQSLRFIATFEIVCSGNFTFDDSFRPNMYVDVKNTWEQKMKAWRCYEGESREFPFPRSDHGLRTLAEFRGMQSGLELAEAFRIVRSYA